MNHHPSNSKSQPHVIDVDESSNGFLLCHAGIWIAKFLSPFKMLMIAFVGAILSSIGLIALAGSHIAALWVFTATLGLSFSTINGATVSWVAAHLPRESLHAAAHSRSCIAVITCQLVETFKNSELFCILYASGCRIRQLKKKHFL